MFMFINVNSVYREPPKGQQLTKPLKLLQASGEWQDYGISSVSTPTA